MRTQRDLLKQLEEHKPIIINYGKGYYTEEDIKDYAKWDDKLNTYRDETGIWKIELLIDIAKGYVEGTKLEIGD